MLLWSTTDASPFASPLLGEGDGVATAIDSQWSEHFVCPHYNVVWLAVMVSQSVIPSIWRLPLLSRVFPARPCRANHIRSSHLGVALHSSRTLQHSIVAFYKCKLHSSPPPLYLVLSAAPRNVCSTQPRYCPLKTIYSISLLYMQLS